ncbi:hypothetical protein KUL42_34410 [Alteromonas sp. KUL42]|nr:hypothetical protein KUL42_34410 [Alteromonas sp. KUL42]
MIGVDAKSSLAHTLLTNFANKYDFNQMNNLLHGDEEIISGDAGNSGAEKRAVSSYGSGMAENRVLRQSLCIKNASL